MTAYSPVTIGCIVEGQWDQQAVPVVVRRVAAVVAPGTPLQDGPVIRVGRNKLVKAGELERNVDLAARKMGGNGGILIVIDADADCPASMGPELQKRASAVRGDLPIGVVLANREYEAWYLAAAESLQGKRGLPRTLTPPANPEGIRDAKGWLDRHAGSHRYSETIDQLELARLFDLQAARQAPSFDKCYREIARIIAALRPA